MAKRPDPCRYCGIPMSGKRPSHWRYPTRDHAVPRARGGGGGRIIMCCQACNQDKGNLSLREWYLHLHATNDPRAERVWEVLTSFDQDRDDLRTIADTYLGKPMPEDIIIKAAQTANGGFDRVTLEAWGVPWPPPKGWKKQLMKHGLPFVSKVAAGEKEEIEGVV